MSSLATTTEPIMQFSCTNRAMERRSSSREVGTLTLRNTTVSVVENGRFNKGIPLEAIATDDSNVTSTYSEIVRLKEFIGKSQVPIRSVIVVSDPHHMRRARWTYRLLLEGQVCVQMAPVPFNSAHHQRRWWTDELSRSYVENQYLKTVYHYARYKFAVGSIKELLAGLDRD